MPSAHPGAMHRCRWRAVSVLATERGVALTACGGGGSSPAPAAMEPAGAPPLPPDPAPPAAPAAPAAPVAAVAAVAAAVPLVARQHFRYTLSDGQESISDTGWQPLECPGAGSPYPTQPAGAHRHTAGLQTVPAPLTTCPPPLRPPGPGWPGCADPGHTGPSAGPPHLARPLPDPMPGALAGPQAPTPPAPVAPPGGAAPQTSSTSAVRSGYTSRSCGSPCWMPTSTSTRTATPCPSDGGTPHCQRQLPAGCGGRAPPLRPLLPAMPRHGACSTPMPSWPHSAPSGNSKHLLLSNTPPHLAAAALTRPGGQHRQR